MEELSISCCCREIGHLILAVATSVLVGESSCSWLLSHMPIVTALVQMKKRLADTN